MLYMSDLNECFESKFLKLSAFTFSNCIISTQFIFLFDTLQQHNHYVFVMVTGVFMRTAFGYVTYVMFIRYCYYRWPYLTKFLCQRS